MQSRSLRDVSKAECGKWPCLKVRQQTTHANPRCVMLSLSVSSVQSAGVMNHCIFIHTVKLADRTFQRSRPRDTDGRNQRQTSQPSRQNRQAGRQTDRQTNRQTVSLFHGLCPTMSSFHSKTLTRVGVPLRWVDDLVSLDATPLQWFGANTTNQVQDSQRLCTRVSVRISRMSSKWCFAFGPQRLPSSSRVLLRVVTGSVV